MSTKPRAAKRPLIPQPIDEAGPSAITDALRGAMKDSGLSAYRLAANSGVNIAAVLRFLSGERSLNLGSVDRLAELLQLELRAKCGAKNRVEVGR